MVVGRCAALDSLRRSRVCVARLRAGLYASGRSTPVEERPRHDGKLLEAIRQMDGLFTLETRLVMMPDHGPEDDIVAGGCRVKRADGVPRLQFFVRASKADILAFLESIAEG